MRTKTPSINARGTLCSLHFFSLSSPLTFVLVALANLQIYSHESWCPISDSKKEKYTMLYTVEDCYAQEVIHTGPNDKLYYDDFLGGMELSISPTESIL